MQYALGYPGALGVIVQVGPGNQAVEIYPADLIFCQNNYMVGRKLFDRVRTHASHLIDCCQITDIAIFQHLHKFYEDFCGTACVVHSPMVIFQGYIQRLCHRIQLKAVQIGQEDAGQGHGVHYGKGTGEALALAVFSDKAHVKIGIVGHHNCAFAEFQETGQHFCDIRLIQDHIIGNACELFDLKGDGRVGVDKGTEALRNLALLHLYCADFDDLIVFGAETGGLYVKYYIKVIQALFSGVRDDFFQVVYQVSFQAVNDFEGISLVQTVAGIRVRLDYSVVCDGYGFVAPSFGLLDEILDLGNSVHIAHFRMAVKLHSFVFVVVYPKLSKVCGFFDAGQGA